MRIFLLRIKQPSDGFTLIEMIVVMALVAIMLAIAIPSFATFTSRYRLSTTSNDFLSGITFTRNEAIKRGLRVTMIPATGIAWTSGWIVFLDSNNDQQVNAGEEVILNHAAMPGSIILDVPLPNPCDATPVSSMFNNGTRSFIVYTASGYPLAGSTVPGNVRFNDTINQRTLCVDVTGRARVIGSN